MPQLEPLPETVEALDELGPFPDRSDDDLLAELSALGRRAAEVVPSLVGVSLARAAEGVTLTLVASSQQVAALDAVQYVDGGPCVEGAEDATVHRLHDDDPLDERRWRLFAAATAAHGVGSTLTLPVLAGGRAVGSVNLYAAEVDAFEDAAEPLAEVFGAWAEGAVRNADLGFATRDLARSAPDRLRDLTTVEVAAGILAARLDLPVEDAGRHLRDAADRAGVDPVVLAHEVIAARWDSRSDRG